MRILIDIAHPAHIHYFRNFAKIFESKHHKCIFTLRNRSIINHLAKYYNLDYFIRSQEINNKYLYALDSVKNIYKIAKKWNPDVFMDMGTVFAAPIARIFKRPYIAFDDTEISTKTRALHMPFTNHILVPNCFEKSLGKKEIRFDSYMEQAYLHPKYFTPNIKLRKKIDTEENEKLVVVRFVKWNAHHDKKNSGLSSAQKKLLIDELKKWAKVIISSEIDLSPNHTDNSYTLNPEDMHDLIANSSLVIGESATMASEAANLGIPAIYFDMQGRGYTREQQFKYGLVYNYKPIESEFIEGLQKAIEILEDNNSKLFYKECLKELHHDKIDLTAFIVWFVEEYPDSYFKIKRNPDYQYNFK